MEMINGNGGLPIVHYGEWGPRKWEDDIDTIVDALNGDLKFTAPALLRAWDRIEDRRCT